MYLKSLLFATVLALLTSNAALAAVSSSSSNPLDTSGNPSCTAQVNLVSGAIPADWISGQVKDIKENLSPAQKGKYTNIQNKGLSEVLMDKALLKWHGRPFTKTVSFDGGVITDQEKSGDCWIYSAIKKWVNNLISMGRIKKNGRLSTNFYFFYSVIEKANSYSEEIISLKPTSLSASEFFNELKLNDTSPEYHIGDGGEFSWMLFLINKYGMVPYEEMPNTQVSQNTELFIRELRKIMADVAESLTAKIKSYGPLNELTSQQVAELRQIKKNGMREVLKYLGGTLGFPPEGPFKVQINAGKPQEKPVYQYFTPKTYAAFANFDPPQYVSIISSPMQPYNRAYKIKEHSSIGISEPGATQFSEHYVNVHSARMAQLVKKMIDNDLVVYFAADVSKDVDEKSGVMDPRLYRTKQFLDVKIKAINRRDAINAGLISPDHAMIIVGYETNKQGQIVRFKVMNSWGKKVGKKGYFSMDIKWFDLNVFEITVERSLLSKNEQNLWDDPNATQINTFDEVFGPY